MKKVIIAIATFLGVLFLFNSLSFSIDGKLKLNFRCLNILSSTENKYMESYIYSVARKNNIRIKINYMDDLDIVDELNNNSSLYDAVWISNSIWLYMLDNHYLTSESKSMSISPVIMGIRKSKAKKLGLIDKDITNADILNLITSGNVNYVMSSVTRTNSGATSYLGFLNTFAGSPEVLSEEMLDNPQLLDSLRKFFTGVKRVSGSESYLEDMFLNDDSYEAIIASEASLININKKLEKSSKDPLYLLYPVDGVPINDSTFAFIDNKKNLKDKFVKLQSALLSDESQEILQDLGRRTWYGGTSDKASKKIFKNSWGIDTTKYLVTTKFPSKKVMNKAFNLYIEELRKPTHVVFCLDFSGSMYGDGRYKLVESMNYILDYEKASKDKLQFSKGDKITVIPFEQSVIGTWDCTGHDTMRVKEYIANQRTGGGTGLYAAINTGLNILEDESDDYTKTVIAMTDGYDNGSFNYNSLSDKYHTYKSRVPVYSIMFGSASREELDDLAELTNGKVFDGRTELLAAFKEVRGYN